MSATLGSLLELPSLLSVFLVIAGLRSSFPSELCAHGTWPLEANHGPLPRVPHRCHIVVVWLPGQQEVRL